MRSFALTAVGADRPGIIAAIAERLLAHGMNVTDSNMGILRGHFATMLIVEGDPDLEVLRADLQGITESLTLREVHAGGTAENVPTHVVSVHGADHPGILASVTAGLAAAGVNVCDLRTRLVDGLYVMVIDVAVPPGLDAEALETSLAAIGEQQDVALSLRAADADVL